MKQKNLITMQSKTAIQRNMAIGLLVMTTALSLVLSITVFYLKDKERVVVVPSVINRDIWVGSKDVSDSYLEQMSEFLIGLVLNVTPSNFKVRTEHLLSHADEASYGVIKEKLTKEQLEIERRGLSTFFMVEGFKVYKGILKVEIKGVLKTWIGASLAESKQKIYQVEYVYRNGRLYIKNLMELKHA